MNIIYKIIYKYLRAKVELEEQNFRNARVLERNRLNNGYSKAGH